MNYKSQAENQLRSEHFDKYSLPDITGVSIQAKKRHAELDGLVKKLYEANATGKLPDKHFSRLLAEYDEEQAALEASMTEWQKMIDNWNADRVRMAEFIDLAKRYTDFSELTTPMLNEFIEKIVVHEGEGRGKQRRQRLDFYFNLDRKSVV